MSEKPIHAQESLNQAATFLETHSEDLARLSGLSGVSIRVGQGWATDLETGEITVDPSFFEAQGYEPNWCVYGTLHELTAHLKEVISEPDLTRQVHRYIKRGPAYSHLHNVVSDLAGNNTINRRLPIMAEVCRDVYRRNMTPESDLRATPEGQPVPRHVQFHDGILRLGMLPAEETVVDDDVQQVIDRLHNYDDTGVDVLYEAARPDRPAGERFELLVNLITPEYEKLLEMDENDPSFSHQSETASQDQSEATADQPVPESSNSGGNGKSTDQKTESDKFQPFYDELDRRHPEPFSEEEHQKIEVLARKIAREKQATAGKRLETTAKQIMEAATGHREIELKRYRSEVEKYDEAIDAMAGYFMSIIDERVAQIKRLGPPSREGHLLHPGLMGQTHVEIQAGHDDPATLQQLETKTRRLQQFGGYDAYLIVDVSGSMSYEMNGAKARQAAASCLIWLEGLRRAEVYAREQEDTLGVPLELDIRTQLGTFGEDYTEFKPLSAELDDKQRLDIYSAALSAEDGSTMTFTGPEYLLGKYGKDTEGSSRKRLVTVITDGQSHNVSRTLDSLAALRRGGFSVSGISIGDRNAVELFKPHGRFIADPAELPIILTELTHGAFS